MPKPGRGLLFRLLVRVGTCMASMVRALAGGVSAQSVGPFRLDNFDERVRP